MQPNEIVDTLLAEINADLHGRLLPCDGSDASAQAMADALDFDGLDTSKPRTITLEMRLPSAEEVKQYFGEKITAHKDIHRQMMSDPEQLQTVADALDAKLEAYYDDGVAKPWNAQTNRGNVRINIKAEPQGEASLLNPERLSENGLCRMKMLSLDGRVIMEIDPKKDVSKHSFGHLSELIAHMDTLARENPDVVFSRYIAFKPDYDHMGVDSQRRIIHVGESFLENTQGQPDKIRGVLLHEQGHVQHQDYATHLRQRVDPDTLRDLKNRMAVLLLPQTAPQRRELGSIFMRRAEGNASKAQKQIEALDEALSHLQSGIGEAAHYLAEVPNPERWSAAALSDDYEGYETYNHHMRHFPDVKSLCKGEVAKHVLTAIPESLIETSTKELEAIPDDRYSPDEKQIAESLAELGLKYKDLLSGIMAVSRAQSVEMHANEYRADRYAIAGNGGIDAYLAKDASDKDSVTHPAGINRLLMIEAGRDLAEHLAQTAPEKLEERKRVAPRKAVQAVARVKAGIKPLHIREQQTQGEGRQR